MDLGLADLIFAGLTHDEGSTTAFVRSGTTVYLDDTGLDHVDGLSALPNGALLAGAEASQQRVQLLGSSLSRIDSYELSWDSIYLAKGGAFVTVERADEEEVTISRHQLSATPDWITRLTQPAEVGSLVIAADADVERVLVAGLVAGSDEPVAWFALLDGAGELQWLDRVAGIESLHDIAVNGSSIVFAARRGEDLTIYGFIPK